MFSRVRIAIRFFFMGLAVGVLLAPRSGKETRRLVRERADRLLNDLLDAATLGAFDSGAEAGGATAGSGSGVSSGEDAGDGNTRGRSGNGRSRSRSGAAQAQA